MKTRTTFKIVLQVLLILIFNNCQKDNKIEYENSIINAAFSSDKNIIYANDTIQLTDESYDHPISWLWSFGDGSISNIQNPTHSFKNSGNYTISLTVNNGIEGDVLINQDFVKVIDENKAFIDKRDNTVYCIVKIGTQTWMAENLNFHTEAGSWYYDNLVENGEIYGRLYNWETAQNVCPNGWHLPSIDEWTIIADTLGGRAIAGGKMKEAGTSRWESPNLGATNESGFNALPGGYRNIYNFYSLGKSISFWTTKIDSSWATYQNVNYIRVYLANGTCHKDMGQYVRCLKD